MEVHFVEDGHLNLVEPLYGTELDIPSKAIQKASQEQRVALFENQVELLATSRKEINGNDCLDAFNLLQMYRDMKIKYYGTLKAAEFLKCEVLSAQNCITILENEVKDLKGCKESLEGQLAELNFKKALEDADESANFFENLTFLEERHFDTNHEASDCERKFIKTSFNPKCLELQKDNLNYCIYDFIKANQREDPLMAEKETQCGGATLENFSKWFGIKAKSIGTQTDISDFNEISSLVNLLNDVTSKYKALCVEKVMMERNLMHIVNEKQVESSKLLREKEIRQKCLTKMEKLKEERDAAVAEYQLVMSERDVVHKEINQLQDQLTEMTTKFQEAQKRIDYLGRSQRTQTGNNTEEEQVMSEFDQVLDETQTEEDTRGQPTSTLCSSQGNQILVDCNDHLAAASVWMQENFKEHDSLKRHLQQTISEFAKRDRIVKERDSMRIMCDRLRQDRDVTMNELIKAKRESDELKKQRNQALGDLKAFEEVFKGNRNVPCSRNVDEFVSHSHSKDSAIDSDFQEWETELINLDIGSDTVGNLGFELAGGHKDRQTNQYVYVKNILSCSPAYGIIQVNDQIIQVNNVDVTGADKALVCQLIRQSPRPLNMLIKRKRSCSKLYQTASQILDSSPQKNSKLDLPPIPPSNTQGGLISRQHLRNTISYTTNHFRPTLYEPGLNDNVGSQGINQTGNVVNGDGMDSNNENLKTKKNIFNKAFMALTKPFKNIPRDVRSKSSTNYNSMSKENMSASGSEAKQCLHRETWPKCRNFQLTSGGKKSRPRLNLDVTFKNDDKPLSKDGVKEEGPGLHEATHRSNSSTRSLKTSFVYHYVQMSDPLNFISSQNDDHVKGEEPDHKVSDQPNASEKAFNLIKKDFMEGANVRTEKFLDLNNETNGIECTTSQPLSPLDSANIKKHERFGIESGAMLGSNIGTLKEDKNNNHQEYNASFHKGSLYLNSTTRQFPRNSCRAGENEDTLWCHPPAHQFLRAVEERVSGLPNQQHLETRNQRDCCLLHYGTVGKAKKACPTSPNICCYEGVSGTKTLPQIKNNFNNSRKCVDATLFSAQEHNPIHGNHPTIGYFDRNVPYLSPRGYNHPSTFCMDTLSNGSFPAFFPRMEKQHVFHTFPMSSFVSPSHTSSSIIPLNSNALDRESSVYNHSYRDYISPSKSDALLDVKQKLCHHLEMDCGHFKQHRLTLEHSGAYKQRQFNILNSNSVVNSLRNVRTSHDASISSLIQSIRSPKNCLPRCMNKINNACQSAPCDSGSTAITAVTPINASHPNFSLDFHQDAPIHSFVDLNEEPNSLFYGFNKINVPRKMRSSNLSTTPLQRNSEPADSSKELGLGGMQVSSISENGLIFNTVFCNDDPLREMMETASKRSLEKSTQEPINGHAIDVLTESETPPPVNCSTHPNFVVPNFSLLTDKGETTQLDSKCLASSGPQLLTCAPTENIVRSVVAEKRLSESLKVNIVGGNTVGIFVSSILEGSVMDGPWGLRVGDKILEFNGVSLCNMLLEEAVLELTKPCEKVNCQVQYSLEEYKKIQNHPCDTLYVRALFSQTSTGNGELSFSKGDVLFVDNTYFNNRVGMWWAYLINKEGLKTKCGTVISRMHRHADGDGYFLDWKSAMNSVVSSGSMRQSFFKRRRPHSMQTRESCQVPSMEFSLAEVDVPIGIPDDEFYGLYERVEKLDSNLSRPVLIVGPFANQIIAKLSKDFPYKFYKFIPEFGRRKCDAGSISYNTETGGIASIPAGLLKNSMVAHHHSLLNFPLDLVPKFFVHNIHFIVILIKFKSYKQIKDSRDSNYLVERISTKQAREMYETSVTMERKFKHLIAEVVPGGCLQDTCSVVMEVIDREQNKPIWLPCP